MRRAFAALVATLLIGCAPIERQETFVEGGPTTSTVGVGVSADAKLTRAADVKLAHL